MKYQIVATWHERKGKHSVRIEPQTYWIDPNDEEIWEQHLSLKEARKKLEEYHQFNPK